LFSSSLSVAAGHCRIRSAYIPARWTAAALRLTVLESPASACVNSELIEIFSF
jgi:hypothetical protein